jgi:hypothetical protein
MIDIANTLISDDVLQKQFVCNLSKCKGACCVEGDLGAPLESDEKDILDDIYPLVRPYLRKEGIEAIESQGTWVLDDFNEFSTPLVNNQECAYVIYDDNGTLKCAIEKAYLDGKVDFKKPISCHLYPIRTSNLLDMTAVNYDIWDICSDACTLGQELQVPVYKFLKEPLIRKFGAEWYAKLETVAKELEDKKLK